MKKIIKICAGASALLAGVGVMASGQAVKTVSAANLTPIPSYVPINTGREFAFSSVQLKKTVDGSVGEAFYIPFPNVSDASAKVKIKVEAGSSVYYYTIDGSDDENKGQPFTLDTSKTKVQFHYGRNVTYKVSYVATVGEKTYSSSIYRVNVTGAQYSYKENINEEIPTIAGEGDQILLPVFTLLDAEGKEEKKVAPKVKKNGKELSVVEKTLSTDGEFVKVGNETDGYKYYLNVKTGTYTVSYAEAGYAVADKVIDISVESWFKSSDLVLDIETLTLTNVDRMAETQLPKEKVNDTFYEKYSGSTNIAHTTVITIKDAEGNVEATLTDNDEYVHKFKKAGEYTIEYKVSTLYLNNVVSETETIKKVVVSDRTAPTVYLVEEYDPTADNWKDSIVKLDNSAIKSRTGWKDFVLPALYAEDAVSSYEAMKNSFVRVVIDSKGNETKVEGDINKPVKYSFPENTKGTYTIEYRAVDEAGRSTPLQFTVDVVATSALDYTDDTNLEITLPSIENDIYADEVKVVKVDPATDDEDEAIETHYYYYYGNASDFTDKYNPYLSSLDWNNPDRPKVAYDFATFKEDHINTLGLTDLKCEDNKLSIALTDFDNTKPNTITVVAIAINDQDQFVYALEEVGIKNNINDLVAPTMEMSGTLETSYVYGKDQTVTLPFATFSDSAKDLKISAKYYINNLENDPESFSTIRYGNTIGGTIPLSKAGVYYVVYTAVDHANNSYDYIVTFEVVKENSYRVEVDYSPTVDVFETSEINAYVYDDEGNKISLEDMKDEHGVASSLQFEEISVLDRDFEGTEVTFYQPGSYSFKVVATIRRADKEPIIVESPKLTITVKDLEYVWQNEASISSYVPRSVDVDEYVNITQIPTYTYGNDVMDAEIEIKDDNGDKVVYEEVKNANGEVVSIRFKAEKKGKYTTTFKAGTKEFEPLYTYVGDNSKPEISILDKDSIPTKITFNDKKITLSITDRTKVESTDKYNIYQLTISAVDEDKKSVFSRDIKVKLFDIDWNGQTAMEWPAKANISISLNNEENSTYKWEISEKGEYVLSIVVTDNAGNKSTAETLTFNVAEKSASKDKKDNKAGIILIVVALVILAGIISFFAFAGKSPKSKKVKPAKTEVKNTEEKDKE